MANLDANTLKLANQAKGMKHQYRSPQQQAALEAARVAGITGFRQPLAPPTQGGAPSSSYRSQGPTLSGNYGTVRNGRYVGPGGNVTELFKGKYEKYPKGSKATVRSGPNDPVTGRPKKHTGRNQIKATEAGIYGYGGEAKWLKAWYKDLEKMGIPAMTPKEFVKWSGYDPGDIWKPGELRKTFKNAGSQHSFDAYGTKLAPGDLASEIDASRITNPEAMLFFANKALGTNYKTMEEAWKDLAPVSAYSSDQYYRWLRGGAADIAALSQPGGENAIPPEIRDAFLAGVGPGYGDQHNANSRFGTSIGSLNKLIAAARNPEKRDALQAALIKQRAATPQWAVDAYNQLAQTPLAQSMGLDMLYGKIWEDIGHMGGVNLTDPSRPFFGASTGGIPTSGERYMRSLSPLEYFTQYAPYQIASSHHPDNKYAGLIEAFGPNALQGYTGSQPYASDPLSYLPSFQRYTAYQNLDPEVLGRNASGSKFYPNDYTVAERLFMFMRDKNKQGQEWQNESWRQHKSQPTGYFNTDPNAWQGDYWSNPNFAAYAPWLLDPATLARLQAIANG